MLVLVLLLLLLSFYNISFPATLHLKFFLFTLLLLFVLLLLPLALTSLAAKFRFFHTETSEGLSGIIPPHVHGSGDGIIVVLHKLLALVLGGQVQQVAVLQVTAYRFQSCANICHIILPHPVELSV